jgi:O-Antigen ligase
MRDDCWLPEAPRSRRHKQIFLKLLSLLLLIYATLGRSGGHIGVPLGGGNGIYIGELVLLFGLAMLMVQGGYERFFALPIAWPWFFFFSWNAAQTLPYLATYGMSALRDAVTYGYSLFAVIVASLLIARPSGFAILMSRYKTFARLFVFFVAIMAPVSLIFPDGVLGVQPPLVGGLLVHTTGTMGFVVCGLVSVPTAWWWAFAIGFVFIVCQVRGDLVAFVAAVAVLRLLYPWGMRLSVRTIRFIAVLGPIVAVMLMLNLNLGVYRDREVGPGQLLQNFVGSFGDTENEVLDETRKWRFRMWSAIVDYTVFGSYFWTGKGYGINLLDDAGLQVIEENEEGPVRSPHNSHLTLLARSGVPGFLLWVALQLTWAVGILRVLFFARRTGRRRTAGLMSFILAYWAAIMVVAATAVVLEGPHDGIWFWAIFGVGAAAAHMVRRDADFFERMEVREAIATSRRAAASAQPFPPPRFT